MSDLAKKIEEAITNYKSVWLGEEDGSLLHITASGNTIKMVEGNGSEYIEVIADGATTFYNLHQIKSIKIGDK